MVTDADTLLNRLSPDSDYITLRVNAYKNAPAPSEKYLLAKVSDGRNEVTGGAVYAMGDLDHIWLCPVTQFVLGGFPKYIEFSVA